MALLFQMRFQRRMFVGTLANIWRRFLHLPEIELKNRNEELSPFRPGGFLDGGGRAKPACR